jgi:alpha-galactosidase
MKGSIIPACIVVVSLGAFSQAAPPVGGWIITSSPDFPGFTRVVVTQNAGTWIGKATTTWYGDMEMQDVRRDGDRLVFKLSNGNAAVPRTDIVLQKSGKGIRLTGRLWYQTFDIIGQPATARQLAARNFPVYSLPTKRTVSQQNVASTPPMGWSSWNKFATQIDDKSIREIADALVASGLRDAGYVYVNIDDGWQGKRDRAGRLQPNANFPDMKALADYLHARGLKLGIYTSPGPKSCAGYEGSYGHVEQDARTFAEWGVDYIKYDLCSGEAFYQTADAVYGTYQQMGEALTAAGRPVVYSLCEYGRFDVGSWGRAVGGHLWRTTGDIEDNYQTMSAIGFGRNGKPKYAGPNGWNDPDMLEVGNGGMSTEEYRSHISLWALLAAPLILGNDVRTMPVDTLALLTNREIIAIDQDRAGVQGVLAQKNGDVEIWTKRLSDGAVAVGVFNRSSSERTVPVVWGEIGLSGVIKVRDLWAHSDGEGAAKRDVVVPGHGVVLLKAWR